MGKLPGGSSKINRLSLNRCPPYTEIFSKRRKIYAVCVESLSMPTRRVKQWVVESCIQIKFGNTLFASTKDRLGTGWMWDEKATYYEMWGKDFRQEGKPYSASDQRPLCWLLSNCRWISRAAERWNVFFLPDHQLWKPTQEGRLGWWSWEPDDNKKLSSDIFWGKTQPGSWLKTSTYQGTRWKKKYAIFDVILVSSLDPALPCSASLLGLLAKIKV